MRAGRRLRLMPNRWTPLTQSSSAGQIDAEDFAGAMRTLAGTRPAVDAFFDDVMVNVEEPAVRANRLHLLARLCADFGRIAEFSLIED